MPTTYELPKAMVRDAMRAAEKDLMAKHKRGLFDDGDPNHPKYNNGINYATGLPVTIFGYETSAFMAKQY